MATAGEDEEAPQRDILAEYTLPDAKFWREWIADSVSMSISPESLVELDALFNRALGDCPHVDLVTDLLDNTFHRYEAELIPEEQVRKICERCISICGGDITDGAVLWRRYIEFEVDECEDVIETSTNEVELKKAKERVVNVFSRQLSLPLAGNQQTLQYLEQVLAEICVESDGSWIKPQILQQKYKNSSELLESRLIYEENLISDSFLQQSSLEDKVTAWKAYIQFEISEKQLSRAQRLYERSLLMCKESASLWLDYAELAVQTLKNWPLAESVTSRAVRACGTNGNITLWSLRFLAIEAADNPSAMNGITAVALGGVAAPPKAPSRECSEKVSRAVAVALQCMYPDANDYLTILAHSSDFRRRALHALIKSFLLGSHSDSDEAEEAAQLQVLREAVSALRKSFDEAESFLEAYYATWPAAWLQVYRNRSSAEDEAVSDALELINPDDDDDDGDDDQDDDDEEEEGGHQGQNKNKKKGATASSAAVAVDELKSQSAAIWERAIARFSKNSFIWLEAIQWTRSICKDFESCRTLYRRALKAVKDTPEEIAKSYVQFEQQVGTLAESYTVMNRVKPVLKAAAATAAANAAAAATTAAGGSYSTGYSEGGGKRGGEGKDRKKDSGKKGVTWSNQTSDSSAATVAAAKKSTGGGGLKRAAHNDDETAVGNTDTSSGAAQRSIKRVRISEPSDTAAVDQGGLHSEPTAMDISSEPLAQPATTAEATVNSSSSSHNNTAPLDHAETTTVFIKNMSFNTTADEIKAHFAAVAAGCSDILEVRMVLSKAGNSRGQAYLDFSTVQQVEEAMKLDKSLLAGRPITVERVEAGAGKEGFVSSSSATAGGGGGSAVGAVASGTLAGKPKATPRPTTTVFVSKFSKDLTSEGLRKLFESCGQILEAKVSVDKRTGESKCHGLVQFIKESGKKAALSLNKTTVDGGHVISVLPSKFAAVLEPASSAAHSEEHSAEHSLTVGTTGAAAAGSYGGHAAGTKNGNGGGGGGRGSGSNEDGAGGIGVAVAVPALGSGGRKPKVYLDDYDYASGSNDYNTGGTGSSFSRATGAADAAAAEAGRKGEKKPLPSTGSLLQFKPRGLQKPSK